MEDHLEVDLDLLEDNCPEAVVLVGMENTGVVLLTKRDFYYILIFMNLRKHIRKHFV